MSQRETIVILDYGSQYTQLIARRVREQHVYAEIVPWNAPISRVEALTPKGLILSGGPNSVYGDEAPTLSPAVEALGVPVLGICYGMHLLAHALGGQVVPGDAREYGPAEVVIADTCTPLFEGMEARQAVWMSHGDRIEALPPGFHELIIELRTALRKAKGKIIGIQKSCCG